MATKEVSKKSQKSKELNGETASGSDVSPLAELRHQMDNLFDDFMDHWKMPDLWRRPESLGQFADFPSLLKLQGDLLDVKFDVSDDGDAMEIKAEMPGIDEKDLELSLSDGILTIKGEKKVETEDKKKDYYCRERQFGSFTRSFRVPDSIDENKIKANFDNGVLDIVLTKRPDAKKKPKKISISKT